MFERQPEEPISILATVLDRYPNGLHENHPAWKADGVIYALSNQKLIRPIGMDGDGSLVYKATSLGETRVAEHRRHLGH